MGNLVISFDNISAIAHFILILVQIIIIVFIKLDDKKKLAEIIKSNQHQQHQQTFRGMQ